MRKNRQALPCLISVLLAFLPSASSFYGDPKYMVLVPFQLHTETPEKICLHLHHLNETVTVRASLQSGSDSRSLFNELVADKDLFHCVSFTIPRDFLFYQKVSLSVHIKGPTHEFSKTMVVLVKNQESVDFVQTNKPMYKPAQSVKFRIVSMDKNLRPLNKLFRLVYIQDPKMNRIMQWRDVSTENGLKQLSFSLSSEPIQGSYKIVIQSQSGVKEHPFTVEEFVLPRFEVQVKVPKAIAMKDETMTLTICAVYTYGKPVPGHGNIKICHKYQDFGAEKESGCKEINYQLDNTGCVTQEENITMFQLKKRDVRVQHLHVTAKVIEKGTGFEFSGYGTTKIERNTNKLIFVKAEPHFRRGIPFPVKVRLVDVQDTPVPNKQVFISLLEANYTSATTTDSHGLAEFSISTTSILRHSITIRVYLKDKYFCLHSSCMAEEYVEAQHVAHRVYSISKSYVYLEPDASILPCSQSHTVQAHFILKGPALTELRELSFYYLVMAQGNIIQTGSHTHHMKSQEPGELKGNFTLEIPVEFGMAPVAKLLIYAILPDGEVIADSAKFEIEKCLLNKVDLSFNPAQSLPASQAHLRVTASPQSLCGLRAVDQSVLLLRPEAELSPSWIYNLPDMQHKDSIPSPYEFPLEDICVFPGHRDLDDIIHSLRQENEKEVYEYLDDMGLMAFTNLKIRHPMLCHGYALPSVIYEEYDDADISSERHRTSDIVPRKFPSPENQQLEDSPAETIRKYFPETWIWDLVTVNSSGIADMEVTVPDTITEWKAGALCLSSDTGLGLSPVVSLQAFQPFFVELTMPYSVIRGEAFTLKATVLNYLPTCIRVNSFLN